MTEQKDVAMQTRCIYCQKEQYSSAVYPISHGECGCAWCGKVPPVMTNKEYKKELFRINLNNK
jgi:hypothetical protein